MLWLLECKLEFVLPFIPNPPFTTLEIVIDDAVVATDEGIEDIVVAVSVILLFAFNNAVELLWVSGVLCELELLLLLLPILRKNFAIPNDVLLDLSLFDPLLTVEDWLLRLHEDADGCSRYDWAPGTSRTVLFGGAFTYVRGISAC